MDTLGQNIFVPLQVDEIKAGLNNSPYYHRHVFRSSRRSLEGLHPYPLRHLAMLSSKERAELLAQCEDVEMQWDLDTPRDQKWRYMKTRERLEKMSQYDSGGDEFNENVQKGAFPAVSVRFLRVQKALDKRGSASPHKNQHLNCKFLTPDDRVSQRDAVLNVIAPRTFQESVLKMNTETASDEELLYTADMFKMGADRTETKLAFLSPAFSQDSSENSPRAHHTTTPKPTPSGASPKRIPDGSSQKARGVADCGLQSKEQQSRDREKPLVLEEDGPLGDYVDIVANESLEEFQRAVVAAAAEDPLSVAALAANWKYNKFHPKILTSTDTEQEPSTDLVSHNGDGAATSVYQPEDDDTFSVESLDRLSGFDDNFATSHRNLEMAESLHERSDTMSEEDVNQTSFHIRSEVPLVYRSTAVPAPDAPATEPLHSMDRASDHEDDSLVNPSIIKPTTHPPEDEGTQTSNAPELIMPTFPLSTSSKSSHEFLSDQAYQVLHGSDQRQDTNANAIARSHVLRRSTPAPYRVDSAATPIDRGTIALDDIAEEVEDTFSLPRHGDAHTHSSENDNGLSLQDTQQPNNEDRHPPHEEASAALSNSENVQFLTPKPQHTKTPSAQPEPPLAPAHVNPDDPVYDAVVFSDETKDNIAVHPEKPSIVKLDVPSFLNFDREQVKDWAQDTLAAIHDHKFSDLAASQHETATKHAHIAGGEVDGKTIEVPDTARVDITEGQGVNPQPATIEVIQNHPEKAAQHTILGIPVAVNELAATSGNRASLVRFADDLPLQPEHPAATPSILHDLVQPPSMYPLPVYRERAQSRSETPLIRHLRAVAYHLSLLFSYYIIVSLLVPDARAPVKLYLAAGTLLGIMWAVLHHLPRQPDQPRAARVVARPKSTTKKRFVKMCGTVCVIAAAAYFTWPGERSGEDAVAVATNSAVRTEMLAVCRNAFGWETVLGPLTTCDANTPTSLQDKPHGSPVENVVEESGFEFASGYESGSDIDDSYGKPKAVATRASLNWPGQLFGLGAGLMLAGFHVWWAQNMLEMGLQNRF
ncbi:hypothetical protein PMIN03_000876 [Paraphaeosphaeria minitans]